MRTQRRKKPTRLSDSSMEYTYHLLWVLENKPLREQTKRPLHYSFDDYKEEAIRNT